MNIDYDDTLDMIWAATSVDELEKIQADLADQRDDDPTEIDDLLMICRHQIRDRAFREIYHRMVEIRGTARTGLEGSGGRPKRKLAEIESIAYEVLDQFKRLVR